VINEGREGREGMRSEGRDNPFVSRGGLKLRHGLDEFKLDVTGLVCADLGCSTGGFTDCLLQAGAARVHAVDTGYGVLAWKLRQDSRVVVHERANALHLEPPERVDLVVMDVGWTPQRLCVPAALRWLTAPPGGRIVTLVKPHYEDKAAADEHRGVLPDEIADGVVKRVLGEMPGLGVRVIASVASPVRGSAAKAEGEGNREWLALLSPSREPPA
jgi:23S rRNA (cytidine1920-2'-O)/16S rRNA (cytidine1409-2'-O)-methyltransferase